MFDILRKPSYNGHTSNWIVYFTRQSTILVRGDYMKCEKCGKEVSADEIICPYCGAVNFTSKKEQDADASIQVDKLESRQTTAPISPKHNESTSPKRDKSRFSLKSSIEKLGSRISKNNDENQSSSQEATSITRLIIGIEALIIGILIIALIITVTLIFTYRSGDHTTTSSSYGADIYYVTNAGDSIDLRQSADNDSDSLATLYSGSAVELVDKTNEDYWEVMDYESGETGYLPTQNLTGDTGRINEGDLSTDRSIKSISFVTNTEEGLAIREELGFDDVITLDTANNGYALGVIEQTNNTFWRVFDFHSKSTGYVECAYLTGDYGEVRSGATEIIGTAEIKTDDSFASLYSRPSANEDFVTGRIRNHSEINIVEQTNQQFWLIYDDTSQQFAYVECSNIDGADIAEEEDRGTAGEIPEATEANTYYVAGTDELALRSSPEQSDDNEMITLYPDEVVILIDRTNDDFWEVYSEEYNMTGYVNRRCLAQY